MAKGGGLSMDSDRLRLFVQSPTVLNSFSDHHHHGRVNPNPPRQSMDHTIQFPVNFNSGNLHQVFPPPIDEMDFFALRSNADDRQRDRSESDCRTGLSLAGDDRNKTSNDDVNTEINLVMVNRTSSSIDDGIAPTTGVENEVARLGAQIADLTEENQRLKSRLSQMKSDYSSLHMQWITLLQEQKNDHAPGLENPNLLDDKEVTGRIPAVPRQFMDLGLAGSYDGEDNSTSLSDERRRNGSVSPPVDQDCNKESGKRWSPRLREVSPDREQKVQRLSPPESVDQATEATMRKARVSIRSRSQTPMMDGCQWRKYGQKMAKGNPHPRAYYRCTMSSTGNPCPVRKQIQKCAEDESILTTSYEGNHNHPLPQNAMAMASATSSAVRSVLSGSMSSTDGLMNTSFLTGSLFPCSTSMATISAMAPFPTITLDLTQHPNPGSNPLLDPPPPSTQQVDPSLNPSALLPQIFGQALLNQSKFSGLQTSSQDSKDTKMNHHLVQSMPTQFGITDSLTEALTSDPNFTAALAAAISSFIGGGAPQIQQ